MTYYRIASPRSRTDRAADILWDHFAIRDPDGRSRGVTTSDLVTIDVVRLRAHRVRQETRDKIDAALAAAGYEPPLRWREESR